MRRIDEGHLRFLSSMVHQPMPVQNVRLSKREGLWSRDVHACDL